MTTTGARSYVIDQCLSVLAPTRMLGAGDAIGNRQSALSTIANWQSLPVGISDFPRIIPPLAQGSMTDWIAELQSALDREFGDKPPLAALASVDRSGAPRARMVVCRRITDDGNVLIVSDSRSEKNDQLKTNLQAEVVFWLPTLREQFRVLGSTRITGASPPDPVRQEIWERMSSAARALFFWPAPGARKIDPPEAYRLESPPDVQPPANFELITVRPRRVEHLQLTVHPHRRRRWMLAGKWSAAAELNP